MTYPNLLQLIIVTFVETFLTLRKEYESELLESEILRKISERKRNEISGEWRPLYCGLHNYISHLILLELNHIICCEHNGNKKFAQHLVCKHLTKMIHKRPLKMGVQC
jgi:hypothetical protein